MGTKHHASFGQWLKKRRKSLDLTQEELARRVGYATISIQSIEAGKRRPSRQMAELLARQLDISEDDYQNFLNFARSGTSTQRFASVDRGGVHEWARLASRGTTNLPAQTTSLIGRKQELLSIRKHLLEEEVRLLSLVGPPGVGKTRLAIEVGISLDEEFEHGVHFVPLATVTDAAQVAMMVAQTLGVNQIGERTFTIRLKEYLRDKHLLLLLDNFEQVTAAAILIGDLLSACPWLSILVTSRSPLYIRGEHQVHVAPLELPAGSTVEITPADLLHYSAVELFVDRSRAITPDFEITAENGQTILAICRRLDALPLAIELAAARINFGSLQMLLNQLQGRELLHENGLQDVSERHQTLYNAINWSYTLLSREEKKILACCSVFMGGWNLAALEKIMETTPPDTTVHFLKSLVNKNLVVQQRGGTRFRLLETIHEYAGERLAESGEEEKVRQLHAEYYLSLVEEAENHLRTESQLVWLECLEAEHENLCVALSWFIDVIHDGNKGLQLVGALGWFWNYRSYVSEGSTWLTKALQCRKGIRSIARARALHAIGMLAWEQGDLNAALTYLQEDIALCRKLGPTARWDLALALGNYGNVVMYQGDVEILQHVAEEAYALFDQLDSQWGKGLILCLKGEVQLLKQKYREAYSYIMEAVNLLCKTGDRFATGVALMDLGYTESLLGDVASFREHIEKSISLQREIGERFYRSLSLNILAQAIQKEDPQHAFELYNESLDLLRKIGIETSIADVQYNLAYFVHAQGHIELAEKLYRECMDVFSKQKNEEGIVKCRAGLEKIREEHGTDAENILIGNKSNKPSAMVSPV